MLLVEFLDEFVIGFVKVSFTLRIMMSEGLFFIDNREGCTSRLIEWLLVVTIGRWLLLQFRNHFYALRVIYSEIH